VVHQAVEYLAAEGLTKTRVASESIREQQVLARPVLESLCQAEDRNGTALTSELDMIHDAYQSKFTNCSFLQWAMHRNRLAIDPRRCYFFRFNNQLKPQTRTLTFEV
jgi:hypothetical protein